MIRVKHHIKTLLGITNSVGMSMCPAAFCMARQDNRRFQLLDCKTILSTTRKQTGTKLLGGVWGRVTPPKSDWQGEGYSCMVKCPQIG